MMLVDVAADYLRTISESQSPESVSHREEDFRVRIHPIVGNPIARSLDVGSVRTWWRVLAELPKRRGSGVYAKKTRVHTLDTLRQIMRHARRVDPACDCHDPVRDAELELPRGLAADSREAPQSKLISVEDVYRLVVYSTTIEQTVEIWLAAHGLRRGEIGGLRLEDVLVDDGGGVTIDVRRSILYLKSGGWEINPGGKGNRLRKVPMVAAAAAALVDLHARRSSAQAKRSDWLLPRRFDSSQPIAADTVKQVVCRAVTRHNAAEPDELAIPRNLHPHALRHAFVTNLLNAGVPITVVPSLVGHASADITVRLYTHATRDPKAMRTAVAILERTTSPPSGTLPPADL